MGKKNFTDGLESLFLDPAEDVLQRNPLLGYDARSGSAQDTAMSSSTALKNELDLFLKENFAQGFTLDDEPESDDAAHSKLQVTKPLSLKSDKEYHKPLSGLDLLIRSTGEISYEDQPRLNLRRFSFFIEKSLLNQMKAIARQRGMYLKDLIIEVFTEFVEKR